MLPQLDYCIGGTVLGGLNRVFVVPVDQVISLPDPENYSILTQIQLAPGAQLTELEMPDLGAEYSEISADNDHGSFYKKKLELFIPKDSPAIAAWINTLGKIKYSILLYCDNNGLWKVIGSQEFPMAFGSELGTSRQANDKFGHTLTWSGEALDKSFFYSDLNVITNPTDPTDPNTSGYATIVDGLGRELARIPTGGVFQINSGFSYGFRILT